MDYKELLQTLSARHQTSPIEVDREIRDAIQKAGFQMSPEDFIGMAAEIICFDMPAPYGSRQISWPE